MCQIINGIKIFDMTYSAYAQYRYQGMQPDSPMEYVSTHRNQQWVSIWITFLSKSASRFLEHTQQTPRWQSWTSIDLNNWAREAIEAALSLMLWKIEDRLRRARQVWGGGGTSTSFPRRLQQKDPPESCWGCGLTFICKWIPNWRPRSSATHSYRNLNDTLSQDIELDLTTWK